MIMLLCTHVSTCVKFSVGCDTGDQGDPGEESSQQWKEEKV